MRNGVDAALKVALPRLRTRFGWLRPSCESPSLFDLCAQRRKARIAATELPLQPSQATPVIVAVDVGTAEASRTGECRTTMEDSEVVKDYSFEEGVQSQTELFRTPDRRGEAGGNVLTAVPTSILLHS